MLGPFPSLISFSYIYFQVLSKIYLIWSEACQSDWNCLMLLGLFFGLAEILRPPVRFQCSEINSKPVSSCHANTVHWIEPYAFLSVCWHVCYNKVISHSSLIFNFHSFCPCALMFLCIGIFSLQCYKCLYPVSLTF